MFNFVNQGKLGKDTVILKIILIVVPSQFALSKT